MPITYTLRHHGAFDGVTGSCHQLLLADSILLDSGLFQGAETSADGAAAGQSDIGFTVAGIQALVLEDALKVGFTRDESLIRRFLGGIRKQLVALSNLRMSMVVTQNDSK